MSHWLWVCGPTYPARVYCGVLVKFRVFIIVLAQSLDWLSTLLSNKWLLILVKGFVSVMIKENKNIFCSCIEYHFDRSSIKQSIQGDDILLYAYLV